MASRTRASGAYQRLLALAMAFWTAVSCASPALAAEAIDDGVRLLYDEAYYATTDYYGNLTDGSVVKSYRLNGAPSVTDYGVYEQVTNLTDGSAPEWNGGGVVFRFGPDTPGHFYFEGKTAAPFRNLPWTLSVHYTLNGVPTRAEDLAGKTGVVEILIDAVPSQLASEYARNNYILVASSIFNQDDILSLEAPGAQLQLIGNLRTALFLAFPGEEQHFSIRVGTEDFSFGGMTFLMVPATLSQLEDVAKLSERKEDLEDSYHKLSDSLDIVLDSFNDMQSDLYDTANGLDTLEQARQTISGGKEAVYGDADALREDLTVIAAALDPLAAEARNASAFVTEGKNAVNALTDTALKLRETLSDGEGVLKDLENGLSAMEQGLEQVESGLTETVSGIAGMEESLRNMETGLADVEDGLRDTEEGLMRVEDGLSNTADRLAAVEDGLSDTSESLKGVEGGLRDTSAGLSDVEGCLSDTEDNLQDVEDDLDLLTYSLKNVENGLDAMERGLKDLEDGSGKVETMLEASSNLGSSLQTLRRALASSLAQAQAGAASGAQAAAGFSANELLAQVVTVGELYNLTGNGDTPDEQAFFQTMLLRQGYDAETAAQLAAILASNDAEQIAAADPDGSLTAAYQRLYYLYTREDYRAFCTVMLTQSGYSAEDAADTARQMSRIWDIYQNSDGDRAALELIIDSMDTVSGNVGGVNRQANELLASLGVPTDQVLKDTSAFFTSIGELDSMVQDALDLSKTLRTASGSLRGASGDLRDLLRHAGETSGTLRDTLGAIRNTSGDLRKTLNALTDTSASLRDTLDALTDTSASLRDTLDALTDTSGSLRDTLASLRDTSAFLRDTLDALTDTSASLRGNIADIVSLSGTLRTISATARAGSGTLREASGIARTLLGDADNLRDVLNRYEPTLQETLRTLETLSATAAGTVRDSNRLLGSAESLMKSAGEQLNTGTRQTLSGLTSTIRKAAGSLDATRDLQEAKDSVTDLIEDTWDEYTGENNNLLLMDAAAQAQSLTSPGNPAPESVQILIRTQEIESDDGEEEAASASAPAVTKGTFLSRIGQMFRDFWNALTGIFR